MSSQAQVDLRSADEVFAELLRSLEPDCSRGISVSYPILAIADTHPTSSITHQHLAADPSVERVLNLRAFDHLLLTQGHRLSGNESVECLRIEWLKRQLESLVNVYRIVVVIGVEHESELAFLEATSYSCRQVCVHADTECRPHRFLSVPTMTVRSPQDLRVNLSHTLDQMLVAAC